MDRLEEVLILVQQGQISREHARFALSAQSVVLPTPQGQPVPVATVPAVMRTMGADPVTLLCCAIACQEGWFSTDPSVIPRTHKNPGDIEFDEQIGATGAAGTIATFSTVALGATALFRQVWELVAMGYTVRSLINRWAPAAAGNNTTVYLQNVLSWTGLPADTPLLDLLPPLVDIR